MIHQFDHRWAGYAENGTDSAAFDAKHDPTREPAPRYWVPRDEVDTLWIGARKEGGRPAPVEWFLALNHPALIPHMGDPIAMDGPGLARFSIPSTTALLLTLQRLYPLARDLPFSPVATFHAPTASLPAKTEVERLTIQRIGQDLFREALFRH